MMAAAGPPASALRGRATRHHAGVDLVLLVLSLGGGPVRLDPRTAWFATPLAPIAVPAEAIPPALRCRRILVQGDLPIGRRVATALAWGDAAGALAAAATVAAPLDADRDLARALGGWAASEAARLGLPADGALAAIGPDGQPRGSTPDERAALAEVRELLSASAWPRWIGPLVLVPHGIDHPALAPGRARLARPALPVLRLPGGADGRVALGVAMADLVMALSAPPAGGWPSWLTAGVAGCARARADGSGIAERAMAERRAAAGPGAIAGLLAGAAPVDDALATAVVAALLHPSRRDRWQGLLAGLRAGTAGADAIARSYGLDPATLAAPR